MSADVVVVGGGAIGLATAWRLAQRDVAVEVVDPHPGGGASAVAAGMLAPVTEARLGEEELLRLSLASWARWPDFAAELAELRPPIGYRADGTVFVALDADDRAALHDLVDRHCSLGLDVGDLTTSELRDLEPGLAPAVRRGARAGGERSVDPPALVAALLSAAERAGVVVRRERVRRLSLRDCGSSDRDAVVSAAVSDGGVGGVDGVELATGERVAATTVVLAAGAWSAGIEGLPDVVRAQVPVRPVKGQVVTLQQRPDDPLVRHTVRGFVRGSSIYVVPRDDGRLVCGATVEEKGWDPTPTAGGAYELLRDVLALFPGLDDAELVGTRVGFRPGSPDDLPLIGRTEVEGLVLATGHYRNGILLTPITAEAVTALVTGEPLPDEVAPCDPQRFSERLASPPTRRSERRQDEGVPAG